MLDVRCDTCARDEHVDCRRGLCRCDCRTVPLSSLTGVPDGIGPLLDRLDEPE